MTGNGEEAAIFAFEGFRLDVRRMGVWRGDAPVPLEPKALDVLRHLVTHRERLVTKDELLDVVWSGTFVTPNTLTRAVAQLRKALGDDAERPRLIETVPTRGYRFVAPVSVLGRSGGDVADPPANVTVSEISSTAGERELLALPVGDAVPPPAAQVPPGGQPAIAAPAERELSPSRAALLVRLAVGVILVALVAATWLWRSAPGDRLRLPQVTPVTAMGDVIDAAISPDGQYLTFVRSADGLQSLWVRQLRGTRPIELVPPTGIGFFGVTFAPDSQSIYYVVRGSTPGGALMQIPLLGGAPRQVMGDVTSHVALSPDGQQVATLRAGVPAAGASSLMIGPLGGPLRPLFSVSAPDFVAPGFFIAPAWSPTGDRLAVTVRRNDRQEARLLVVDRATGSARAFPTIYAAASHAAWLPDGSGIALIAADRESPFEAGTQLWLQPLPAGEPYPLTSGVADYRNVTLARDGTSLLSVGSTFNGALWLLPIDGEGAPRRISTFLNDGAGGVTWLGDDRVAFTATEGDEPQVWSMHVDGSERRQLTSGGAHGYPRASSDGRDIYYGSRRSGGVGLWRMNADGGDARRLVAGVAVQDVALSPDDRTVFFTAPHRGLESTWRVPSTGGQPTLVVAGLVRASVSPDGRMIAGIWRPDEASTPSLAVFSMSGELLHRFDGRFPATNTGGVWWAADGQSLFFTTAERLNVWKQSLAGGEATPVTRFGEGMIVRADLSRDRRTLVAFRGNVLRDAFLVTGFR